MIRHSEERKRRRVPRFFASLGITGLALAAVTLPTGTGSAADCPPPQALRQERISVRTQSGEPGFQVEIADTDAARSAGLMCRRELAADHGMLFIYPRAQIVRMWMENTWVALDMIFIAADGRIVKIVPDVPPQQPGRISSGQRVKTVLELPAGAAARAGIRVGDTLRTRPSPRAAE